MTRVNELHKKYPNLPRDYIVKWEVLNHGVRDTEALDKTSEWTRAGSYQSRDLDVTVKEIGEKRPWTLIPGRVMRPRPLYMKSGIGARIARSTRTPYEIREESEGQFALYEGAEKVENIYFPSPKTWGDNLVTSKGTPVSSLISVREQCFTMQPIRFCEYFTRGKQCKFCNYNSTYDHARSTGANIPITINLEDAVEAYKMASSEIRLIEGGFQSGALSNREQEAATHINFVERIASAAPYKPHMDMSIQPTDRKGLQRLKDAGLACIHFNLEVWGSELFSEVCPGKAKYRGFEHYKEGYLEAVDVFGPGYVGCNFVAGVSLMPPNGHKTWQESRDSMLEGFRWLIKNGVFPTFLTLRLGVGSVYGDDKANWLKAPPTEYYLEAAMGQDETMVEFGLYEKLDKLMSCPLDNPAAGCHGELGMIALAGDIGKWAALCFPAEANWLGRFISSVNA